MPDEMGRCKRRIAGPVASRVGSDARGNRMGI